MNALRNAPFVLAALALPLTPASAGAKPSDVRVYSAQEASDLLNEPVESNGQQAVCGPKEILLDDGTCAATRGFSLARVGAKGASAAPAPAPQLVTRPAQPRVVQYAPGAKPAAAVTARKPAAGKPSGNVPLQFTVGSFELSAQSKANLVTLARALNSAQHQGKRVRIVGHTDRSGKQETNLVLSQKRADAVAGYLASKGVDMARIDTLGVADTVMIAGVSPFDGRQRRVEVTRVQ